MRELILGGARSGKSGYAQQRAEAGGLEVVYVATGLAGDEEMQARIARHRAARPAHWLTIEAPLDLAGVIAAHAAEQRCLLVDCMTLWLSNQLGFAAGLGVAPEGDWSARRSQFLEVLSRAPGHIVLVSNEVGNGIIPADPLSRQFCDEAGWLNQSLAQACERVVLMTAGLPQLIKDEK